MQFYFAMAGGLGIFIALIFLIRAFLKPNGRRILYSVISWFGFAIILAGLIGAIFVTVRELLWLFRYPDSWLDTWEGPGPGFLFILALIVVYIGIVPMLIGGLIAKPRYFSIISLIIGITCILAFYFFLIIISIWEVNWIGVILTLLPGMACIITSLIVREKERQIINQINK